MKVELRFRASEDCVHGYLVSQHVDFDQEIDWPFGPVKANGETLSPTRPPFQEEEMKRLNLHLDPGEKCAVNEFRTPSGALLKVLVDPRGEEETVYLVSRSTGK